MANSAAQGFVSGDNMTLALNSKSMEVVSTLYESLPELAILGIHQHKKPEAAFGMGDPDPNTYRKGVAFGGAKVDPIKVKMAEQIGTYSPLVQTVRQNDFKRKSYRDTGAIASAHSGTDAVITVTVTAGVITAATIGTAGTGYSGAAPTLSVVNAPGSCGFGAILKATVTGGVISAVTILNGGRGYASSGNTIIVQAGASAGEKFQRPIFRWAEIEHTGTIYDRDVDSVKATLAASPEFDGNEAMMSLVSGEIVDQMTNHATQLSEDLWYGNPTVGNTDSTIMYDQAFGFLQAIDDSNVYGGVDRALPANAYWRAKVDASGHPGIGFKDLVEDAHQTKGLAYKNGGLDLLFVPPSIFSRWKAEELAYTTKVQIQDDLREYGKYGFKHDVIQYGQTLAIGCSRCPEGTVLGLNMKAILILFKTGKKLQPTELKSQKGIKIGGVAGIDGSTFDLQTEWMPMLVAPELCIKYTGIS